jgi:hypothetical protein
MRAFYLAFPKILQTVSAKSFSATNSFQLHWSHYVKLLSVENPDARESYLREVLRGGWSVRQLDRQISTLFFERALASRKKRLMLESGAIARPDDLVFFHRRVKCLVLIDLKMGKFTHADAAQYRTELPEVGTLVAESIKAQRLIKGYQMVKKVNKAAI